MSESDSKFSGDIKEQQKLFVVLVTFGENLTGGDRPDSLDSACENMVILR